MPFLFAVAALGILWGGSRSGWTTDADRKRLPAGVHGFPGRRWVTWVIAWQGRKIAVGPHCCDAAGALAAEASMRVLRPGATVFRFVLDR